MFRFAVQRQRQGSMRIAWAQLLLLLALLMPTTLAWGEEGDEPPAQEVEASELALLPKPIPGPGLVAPGAFRNPESLEDMRQIQERVQELIDRVGPSTVAVHVGGSSASGVVISPDGVVLTAAHVCGDPDSEVSFTFPDGKKARGKTLGANHAVDSGLMQIVEEGPWPYANVGEAGGASTGDWVVALGHPGGFDRDRPLVARLGRIIRLTSREMRTDCTIVGGDSGGPLFDLDGRVIAIHSRISRSVASNYHVPIATYLATWERLAKKEHWGDRRTSSSWVGASGLDHPEGCMLERIVEDSPASEAGLQVGDIITKLNGKAVEDYSAFVELITDASPGDNLTMEVIRDGIEMGMMMKVGTRRGRGRSFQDR